MIDDFKTIHRIGNKRGTGELILTDSIRNYKFLFVSFGYYESGFPCFGCSLIPVYIVVVTGESAYSFRVNASDTNSNTDNIIPHYSAFYFLSPSKVKIFSISDQNRYTTFMVL